MSNEESTLEIELALLKCSNTKLALAIIRKYVAAPVVSIQSSLECDAAFARFILDKSVYYNGWQIAYQLAQELVRKGFELRLQVNGSVQDLSYLHNLKSKVMTISRPDIC
ncbi:hypothetical protein ABC502_09230 [Alkalimonas sp. NCh-2]|uniref:hypothetical protein n=1 Tax=Alkalimonas sp. NCh-2 TaxID=3144846 RepID=UPI0031F65E6D